MDKKWLVPVLAGSAVVLLACCAALVFVGARVLAGQAAPTCSDASLTPEEKANCGIHSYQLEEKLTSYCSIMKVDNGARIVTAAFSGNTMTTSIHRWVYTRIGANEYNSVLGKLSPTSNIDKHIYTIRLGLNGFTENYAYELPGGKLIDCWLDTYTITR